MGAGEWKVVLDTKPTVDGLARLRSATKLVVERAGAKRVDDAARALERPRAAAGLVDDREVMQ